MPDYSRGSLLNSLMALSMAMKFGIGVRAWVLCTVLNTNPLMKDFNYTMPYSEQ